VHAGGTLYGPLLFGPPRDPGAQDHRPGPGGCHQIRDRPPVRGSIIHLKLQPSQKLYVSYLPVISLGTNVLFCSDILLVLTSCLLIDIIL